MPDQTTPMTIVFIHDRSNERRWVLELPEWTTVPESFDRVVSLLRQDPEVEDAWLIGCQLHIWLTPACKPTSWNERIRPIVVIGVTAVFNWRPQPTPVERKSNRPLAIIP